LTYWNNIRKNLIRVGQKLAIYVPEKDKSKLSASVAVKSDSKQAASSNADYELYTVRNGDNVWEIAQKYDGVTTDDIMQLNNISNEKGLVVGQKLKIRKKT
jgi:membrane-bound lytic murein transglycosylase D